MDMETVGYLKLLVEDIHSAIVATLGEDGYPQTRAIDMMLYDETGVYFLTAKGKSFYSQLMEQKFIALSAVKDKISVSLRGNVQNIGSGKLDEIFEKNIYMQEIYPEKTRNVLEVFKIVAAQGEYFDISNPSYVVRDSFILGNYKKQEYGYFVGNKCTQCGACYSVCPQKCIDMTVKPVVIDQKRCLHCGRCSEICPLQAVGKRG